MTVYDSVYLSATKELTQNLKLMKALRPILWLIVGSISFLAGFLAARSRQREIAVLRSLGSGKVRVFWFLLLEQMSLALIGQ